MKIFTVSFMGKPVNSLGLYYKINCTINANSQKSAINKIENLYDVLSKIEILGEKSK